MSAFFSIVEGTADACPLTERVACGFEHVTTDKDRDREPVGKTAFQGGPEEPSVPDNSSERLGDRLGCSGQRTISRSLAA